MKNSNFTKGTQYSSNSNHWRTREGASRNVKFAASNRPTNEVNQVRQDNSRPTSGTRKDREASTGEASGMFRPEHQDKGRTNHKGNIWQQNSPRQCCLLKTCSTEQKAKEEAVKDQAITSKGEALLSLACYLACAAVIHTIFTATENNNKNRSQQRRNKNTMHGQGGRKPGRGWNRSQGRQDRNNPPERPIRGYEARSSRALTSEYLIPSRPTFRYHVCIRNFLLGAQHPWACRVDIIYDCVKKNQIRPDGGRFDEILLTLQYGGYFEYNESIHEVVQATRLEQFPAQRILNTRNGHQGDTAAAIRDYIIVNGLHRLDIAYEHYRRLCEEFLEIYPRHAVPRRYSAQQHNEMYVQHPPRHPAQDIPRAPERPERRPHVIQEDRHEQRPTGHDRPKDPRPNPRYQAQKPRNKPADYSARHPKVARRPNPSDTTDPLIILENPQDKVPRLKEPPEPQAGQSKKTKHDESEPDPHPDTKRAAVSSQYRGKVFKDTEETETSSSESEDQGLLNIPKTNIETVDEDSISLDDEAFNELLFEVDNEMTRAIKQQAQHDTEHFTCLNTTEETASTTDAQAETSQDTRATAQEANTNTQDTREDTLDDMDYLLLDIPIPKKTNNDSSNINRNNTIAYQSLPRQPNSHAMLMTRSTREEGPINDTEDTLDTAQKLLNMSKEPKELCPMCGMPQVKEASRYPTSCDNCYYGHKIQQTRGLAARLKWHFVPDECIDKILKYNWTEDQLCPIIRKATELYMKLDPYQGLLDEDETEVLNRLIHDITSNNRLPRKIHMMKRDNKKCRSVDDDTYEDAPQGQLIRKPKPQLPDMNHLSKEEKDRIDKVKPRIYQHLYRDGDDPCQIIYSFWGSGLYPKNRNYIGHRAMRFSRARQRHPTLLYIYLKTRFPDRSLAMPHLYSEHPHPWELTFLTHFEQYPSYYLANRVVDEIDNDPDLEDLDYYERLSEAKEDVVLDAEPLSETLHSPLSIPTFDGLPSTDESDTDIPLVTLRKQAFQHNTSNSSESSNNKANSSKNEEPNNDTIRSNKRITRSLGKKQLEEQDRKPPAKKRPPRRALKAQRTNPPELIMPYEYATLDTGADTIGIGGDAWIIEEYLNRRVCVHGYKHKQECGIAICNAYTACDLPNGETYLLKAYEGMDLGAPLSLLSHTQMKENGAKFNLDYTPSGDPLEAKFPYIEIEGVILPLSIRSGTLTLKIRRPSEQEMTMDDMPILNLSAPSEWIPSDITYPEVDATTYNTLVERKHKNNKHLEAEYEDIDEIVDDDEEIEEDLRVTYYSFTRPQEPIYTDYTSHFLYPPENIMRETFRNTTQLGTTNTRHLPMKKHYKNRNPLLQSRRLNEGYATDTMFSTITSYEDYNCAQVFVGLESKKISLYGLRKESQAPKALLDFLRQDGVPLSLSSDNALVFESELWQTIERRYWIKRSFTEPYHPHQNLAERMIGQLKAMTKRLMADTGCSPESWFLAMRHAADVHNCTANENLEYRTPIEAQSGETPDISGLCIYRFWDLVYYLDPRYSFPDPGGNERLGRWVGRAHNYGDGMCFYVLDEQTKQIIVRSTLRRAEDTDKPNRALDQDYEDNPRTPHNSEAESEDSSDNFPIIDIEDRISNENQDPNADLFPPRPTEEHIHKPVRIHPNDLIDKYIYETFPTKKGTEKVLKGYIETRLKNNTYRVEFENGKQKTYDYEELINMLTKDQEEDTERWTFDKILKHRRSKDRNRRSKYDILIKWEGYDEPTWEPMEILKQDDPVTIAKYAEDNGLLDIPGWKWAKLYRERRRKLYLSKTRKTKGPTKRRVKYQFGERVPRTLKEAYEIDEINKNTKWADAIQKEVDLLKEYECFRVAERDERDAIASTHQRIVLLWTFAIKYDLRYRARCVAGGHMTPDLEDDLFSGVANLGTVRVAFVAAAALDLDVVAGDVSHAYIQAYTIERIYTIAGHEFGPDLEGKMLVVIKALYGLKSSGAMWHRKFAENLRDMGFLPMRADPDFHLRQTENGEYEYIAVIVDDLLVFSKKPYDIIDIITKKYKYDLKGIGTPEYYSGADIQYHPRHNTWSMSARTYITNVCSKIERLLGLKLKNYGSPMLSNDHPELDDTSQLYDNDQALYQMLLGSLQWAVTLGRFDIQYATNTLARYGVMPREGHFQRALRIFGYLKHNDKAKVTFDPRDPELSRIEFIENEWTDIYPNAQEHLPDNMPTPAEMKELAITIYVDASHASDLVTRRSVTGYIICIGQAIVKWYSKRQNTVETSTYGSELVALKHAVEAALEIRYMLRMMGLRFERTSTILCDNMGVVYNMQYPSSSLKKKANSVAYHKCREAIAAGIVRLGHINGDWNLADLETKPKGPADYHKYLKAAMYRNYEV